MTQEDVIEFKAKVGAWALDENRGIAEASRKFGVSPDRAYAWAKLVLASLCDAFIDDDTPPDERENIGDQTRETLVRLASEYGKIQRDA